MKLTKFLNLVFNKLFISDKWNIGYLNQTAENLIDTQKFNGEIKWLKENKCDYNADPFIINLKEVYYIYYEELIFWKGKGEIMVTHGFDFKNKKKVIGFINNSIHFSYPYIFKDKNNIYCIPETSAEKKISLYQIDKDKPWSLKKINELLDGENFVDTSIICFKGMYWLFTSKSGIGGELYVYYSNSLLCSFKPHALNPIPVANHISRAAGALFTVDNKLYRPSQNPTNCYGGSIMINEVTLINEMEFNCTTLFELLPQAPYKDGLHTINFVDNLIIVDGKRCVFNPTNPLKKIFLKLK